MKINIKNLLLVFVAFSGGTLKGMQQEIYKLPLPRVFINEWHNLTNKEITINSELPNKTHLAIIKPQQKVILNKELLPSYDASKAFYFLDAEPIGPNAKGRFQFEAHYYLKPTAYHPTINEFELYAYLHFTIPTLSFDPIKFSFASNEDIKDAIIQINVKTQGHHWKHTTITAIKTKVMTAKTLHELSLESVAKQVKARTMTLEQAKKILPADLHEKLEAAINK